MWRKKGFDYDPKHTSSSGTHGGGSVLAWAYMVASETGSFIDDVTQDCSSRMNSEVYRNFWSANLQRNASKTNREEVCHAAGQ